MSHIFDALQRQEAERSGIDPSTLSVATELLQMAERTVQTPEPISVPPQTIPAVPDLDQVPVANEFESLPLAIPPQSRLVSLTDKDSLAAEKFRYLGVRLRQQQQNRPLKKVLITSTIPEEGKSMVAANLACTLARRKQQRTLLIDGDLRRPTLAKQFGLPKVPGLSEWLQRGTGPVKNIYRLEAAGIWILPAGSAPQNALELMQTGALSAMMKELSSRFDWIIIDSPPLLPLADTSVWVRLADGVLLVSREGKTEKQQLKRGLEALDQSKLLGAVINSTSSMVHSDYYYRYAQQGGPSRKQPETVIPPDEQ